MADECEYVVPIGDIRGHLGNSNQADNIYKYLQDEEVNAKTAVIEPKYIDKDYFIDYAGFYARSFEKIERCTKRVHFFSGQFDQKTFENVLVRCTKKKVNSLGNYLGFVVIKQFKDQNGNSDPQIGRTLLAPYSTKAKSNSDKRKFIQSRYRPSLYGIDLCIETLPFQAQDHAVAACATTSLWIANSQLMTLFQTPRLSPIEVTNRATSLIEYDRNLPNKGLTTRQMLAFLKSVELDFEYIYLGDLKNDENEIRELVPDTVKVFVDAKIPIIAGLSLIKYDGDNIDPETGRRKELAHDNHAVVISGYRQDSFGKLNRLYVHDDQIGPYSRVENGSNGGLFLKWKNEWVIDPRYGPIPDTPYDDVILDDLLFPLYPKIRLSYREVYLYCLQLRETYTNFDFQLQLVTINDYKRSLTKPRIEDKPNILKTPLPRFMYVICAMQNGDKKIDFVLDATSHKIRIIEQVIYI